VDHRFFTNLSIEECHRRLSALRSSPRFLERLPAQNGDSGVFRDIQGEQIRLFARSAMAISSFRRIFYGRLRAVPDGTLIAGEFRIHLCVRVFMACWLTFVGLFLLVLLVAALAGSAGWLAVAIPTLIFVGGMIIFILGPPLGRAEEDDVLSYIWSHLEASRLAAQQAVAAAEPQRDRVDLGRVWH
jgi:hypothetical protein